MRPIKVAARDSLLSQKQVEEVLLEIKKTFPQTVFEMLWMKTTGDLALEISLLGLEKTNFFTKELDECLLSAQCDIAIHSAKDLPDPLPEGLQIYALTKGVDPSDTLVLREHDMLHTLPQGAKIGTSSFRRMRALLDLRSDFIPVDIRGTIHRRLELLSDGYVDGIVMAEAALIRLGLTHLNRILLHGESAPLQGRLAVVGKTGHTALHKMFEVIHAG